MTRLNAAVMDRAVGTVVASAAGDALGAPYEFGPANPALPCAMEGGGGFGWAPGEWTDDTQMALAILTTLSAGSTDSARMGSEMVEWYRSKPVDVGNQTRSVLGAAVRNGAAPRDAAVEFQRRNPDAAGNGALMRTGPVALGHLGDPLAVASAAMDIAALTHPHPDSVEACALWSMAIERAITTARPDEAFDFAGALLAGVDVLPPDRRELWVQGIVEAAASEPTRYTRNNGWVVGAFQAALAAICAAAADGGDRDCSHLVRALQLSARSGGDTDTVAAIAGSLLGARWGASAVPLEWRRVLHGRRRYGVDSLPLRCADLESMARLAVAGGHPDADGWPGALTMVAGYIERQRSAPMVVDIDGVRFGNAAGIVEAVATGSNVVVSLCRVGTHDVPAGVTALTVPLIDSDRADNPNLTFVLADTARTIAAMAERGEAVFVHCVAAENRTPAMAAAYLSARGVTIDDAVARVAAVLGRRPKDFLVAGLGEAARLLTAST